MTRIIITGAKGRMGKALIACAPNFRELEIVGQIDVGDDLGAVIARGDVVVDFSSHTATPGVAEICAKHKKALVIGTTGHTDTNTFEVRLRKAQIPIVWASNFSTGVNTLFWLTRKAAEILGPDFDLEIVEMHHRLKKDAPSGTAKSLAEILADVRKLQLEKVARHGRVGIVGERVGFGNRHSFRARRRCGGRSHGHFCEHRRAARTDPQGVEPRHLCQRRVARGALGGEAKARPLRHARCPGLEIIANWRLAVADGNGHYDG